jgi:hypothetical protein
MRAVRWVCLVGALAGCKKAPEAPVFPPGPAEVEMRVDIDSSFDAGRTLLFISREPCDSPKAGTAKFGTMRGAKGHPTFIEIFVPQGSTGYTCAAAYDDAGNMIGLGSAPDNPHTFAGIGEVQFHPKVQIDPFPAPRPALEGLPAP